LTLGEIEKDSAKSPLSLRILEGLIATTALVHDFILVTRNVTDVETRRVSILNA
jgi:predicted nucleic acid-binding protein